ncbi:MAG: HAMP domain-containing sensor histidine kinase [Gemmatimonadales bacterium]
MESERQPARSGDLKAGLSVQKALHRYMEQAPLPFAITRGAGHTLVYANAAFCHVAGLSGNKALGAPITGAFTGTAGKALAAILDQAFLGAAPRVDARIQRERDGETSWKCAVWPVVASDGRPEGLGIELREAEQPNAALDLQRQVAEQMLLGALRERGLADDAEAARRRAAFLAEAGRLLAESVDRASTLMALTRLALPSLGSWCIVDLVGAADAIQRLGIFHPDPEKQKLAHELEARWAPAPDDPFGAAAMLQSTGTISITDDIEATLAATANGAENLDILRLLGVGSLLTVPLLARGKLLGAVTFVSAQHGRPYSAADVQLAEDLAHRGALALDNAQLYDAALVLKQTAETANQAKTAFLGAMSHELRTPLNAIGGYVELLDMGLRGPVTEQQRADFARVKTNQQHLLVLITEILNYARLGGGHASYNVIDFNAHEALVRALELLEPLVAQRGLVCELIACDSGIEIRADPEKMTQILVNLLSNAIKFTPAGGRISVECEATDDIVHVHVSDTGIGIPANQLETIFEPFVQLQALLADREGGVGLGLAISRDLARAMDGDLSVESTEGNGSRFTLSLPRSTTVLA